MPKPEKYKEGYIPVTMQETKVWREWSRQRKEIGLDPKTKQEWAHAGKPMLVMYWLITPKGEVNYTYYKPQNA